MGATLTRKPSQKAFEKALSKHLARREQLDTAVPDVEQVRGGVELAALDAVRDRLGLSQETLERTLSVSARTLQRRRNAEDRLTAAESDRLWRLLHVFELALEAFDQHDDAARSWLTTPKALLGGETPLDRLDTEPGLREVEDMLTVIDETGAA